MCQRKNTLGIKLWELCDAITHYCVALFCYKGVINGDRTQTDHGQAYNVVITLLGNWETT